MRNILKEILGPTKFIQLVSVQAGTLHTELRKLPPLRPKRRQEARNEGQVTERQCGRVGGSDSFENNLLEG